MVWRIGAIDFVSLLVALAVICGGLVHAKAVETINYTGTVSKVVGTPFGINAIVGVTKVSGSFLYDLNTSPISDHTVNVDSFAFSIPNGFTLGVNGSTLSSSRYVLENINNVSNFGGSDIFRAVADSDIGPITFDNTSATGFFEVLFVDLDKLLFPTNTSVSTLLSPTQIFHKADLIFGDFGQDSLNFIEFKMEPDSDRDGIPDAEDACLESNLDDTVVIDGCNSEVSNALFPTGCTISDQIEVCANGAGNHGEFMSCVAELTNKLKRAGIIAGQQKGAIRRCAARANIP